MTNGGLKKHCASQIGKLAFIAAMLVCSVGLSNAESPDNEKLRMGVMVRDMEMIQSAIQAGADPNYVPENKESPLWIAAFDKNAQILELLLEKGGDPNQVNRNGTPLLITASRVIDASRDNRPQVVKLLLRYGADIEVMDKKKRYRPLNMAATFGTYETLKTLLENGANPNNIPTNGFPALFSLRRNKHCKLDCVELLLAHGADPDLPFKKGKSTYRESAMKSADRERIELIEKYFPAKK
jgi:ankyrin repeat protein